MQEILFIVNGPPYGTEDAYSAFRLAMIMGVQPEVHLKIFLISDAVQCAKKGQQTPTGYYNLEKMVISVVQKGAIIGTCGTCMDARGMTDADLINGVHRSSLKELTEWIIACEKVLTF